MRVSSFRYLMFCFEVRARAVRCSNPCTIQKEDSILLGKGQRLNLKIIREREVLKPTIVITVNFSVGTFGSYAVSDG